MSLYFVCPLVKTNAGYTIHFCLARRKIFMICIDGELTRECISRVICIIVRELIDMI